MMNGSITEIAQLHRVASQYKALRQWTLCLVVLVSVLGWYLAWLLLCLLSRRRRPLPSRLLFENLLVADALVLFSPMLAQFTYEVRDELKISVLDLSKVSKLVQIYSLSLSAYMLVSLAWNSYQGVAKGADDKKSPSTVLMAAPHSMALWVTATLYCASGDRDSIYLSLAQYPFPFCKPFVLIFVYAVPTLLLAGLLARLAAHPRHNSAQMASVMCMWFLLTNTPFLLAQAAGLAGANVATLLEILSVVNRTFDPYVFVAYQYEKGCFGDLVGIGRTGLSSIVSRGSNQDRIEEGRRGRARY